MFSLKLNTYSLKVGTFNLPKNTWGVPVKKTPYTSVQKQPGKDFKTSDSKVNKSRPTTHFLPRLVDGVEIVILEPMVEMVVMDAMAHASSVLKH